MADSSVVLKGTVRLITSLQDSIVVSNMPEDTLIVRVVTESEAFGTVGHYVTTGSILLAGAFALGAQWLRRYLDDRIARRVINEELAAALWPIPKLARDIERAIATGHPIPERMLATFDVAREGYDAHSDKVYLLPNASLNRDVVQWFRTLRMARILIGRYVEGSTIAEGDPKFAATRRNRHVKFWRAHSEMGQALFRQLGFVAPSDDATELDSPISAPDAPSGEASSPGEGTGAKG